MAAAAARGLARARFATASRPPSPFTQRDLDFIRERLAALAGANSSNSSSSVSGDRWAAPAGARREAAVLIPLCHVQNEAAILFTVRSSGLRNHGSEVRYVTCHPSQQH